MDHLDQYKALARYNCWMNERLYTIAGELTDEELELFSLKDLR